MDYLLPLLSVVFGLVLLNFTILVKATTCRTKWIAKNPIEVRYIAFLAFILLIALNGNQWIPGNYLFPILTIAGITAIAISIGDLTYHERKKILRDGLSLLSTQIATLSFVFIAFHSHKYWLLEAHNHDSLIYHYGSYWVSESRLFVGSEAVRAKWGFDGWIGFDKKLYRGGTYTLSAWMQYFSPRVTANGLYYIAVYSATMAWFAIGSLAASIKRGYGIFANTFFTIAVALSTGLIGALVNSNFATVMGSASLVVVFAVALRPDIQPKLRYWLMGAWCAVGAHFYGETVFYAGLLIFLVFIFELTILYRTLKLQGLIYLGVSLAFVVMFLGNIPVIQSFSSLFLFSEIAKGGVWASWYMHQTSATWIGSFVAGLLMGSAPSIPMVGVASVITIISAMCLLYSSQLRAAALALISVSLLAVTYVEITSYQYGEHKIIHLLGASWSLVVVAAVFSLMRSGHISSSFKFLNIGRKLAAVSLVVCFGVVVSNFLSNTVLLLKKMRGHHSLDFGLTTMTSFIRPGASVLVDDMEWIGVESFLKSHYLSFQLQYQGAKVLMPKISSNVLRGGYQRDFLNDTLKGARTVDWLIKSKGSKSIANTLTPAYGDPVFENKDYRLYRINKQPVIVAGDGWFNCEQDHCWTMAPFEIEIQNPSGENFELLINFSTFSPPDNGLITVRDINGKIIQNISAREKQMSFKLPAGWSRLFFEPDWSIYTPKDLGISKDPRRLFLRIQQMELKAPQGRTRE